MLAFFLLYFSLFCGCFGQMLPANLTKSSLCNLLEIIENGDRLSVVVTGIYVEKLEYQVFYDPNQPQCEIYVQPFTWVEFSHGVSDETQLDHILSHERRAYVTFKGTLVGPEAIGPDTPSLPPVLAYLTRKSHRYGHLNSFRTELLVDAVVDARPVPKSVPWDMEIAGDYDKPALEVDSAEAPRYPWFAYRLGISGEVEIEVKVSSGKVIETKVIKGDGMLAAEAVENIRTWKFAAYVTSTFTTKFVYSLEKGPRLPTRNPRIELELPFLVKVTAPYYGW